MVSILRGTPPRTLKVRSVSWQRDGFSGYGVLLVGTGDAEFEFTAIVYSSGSGVVSQLANLEALQGQVVTIVDDFSISHTQMFIREVRPGNRRTAIGAGGARIEVMIRGLKLG